MAGSVVRPAVLADFTECFDLGREMITGTPWEPLGVTRRESHKTFANCVASQAGFAWVACADGAVVGVLLGSVLPWPLSDKRYVTDQTFAVKPGSPGAAAGLLDAFSAWAANKGLPMFMAVSSGVGGKHVDMFYESRGFTRQGSMFHKAAPAPGARAA